MSEAAFKKRGSMRLHLGCAGVKSVGDWGSTKPLAVLGTVVPGLSLSPLAVLALSSLSCLWLTQNPCDIFK